MIVVIAVTDELYMEIKEEMQDQIREKNYMTGNPEN